MVAALGMDGDIQREWIDLFFCTSIVLQGENRLMMGGYGYGNIMGIYRSFRSLCHEYTIITADLFSSIVTGEVIEP